MEVCALRKPKHINSWLVQLATRTKRKVSEVVEKCPLVMNGLNTCVDLNVLPLGSYHCSHWNGLVGSPPSEA